jgi:hypothetical protein
MNTSNILDILLRDKFSNKHFVGVGARDEFEESFNSSDGIHIFNTDYSNESGEHWIAVIRSPNKILYFDSYGRDPSTYSDIEEVLNSSHIMDIEWNNKLLQGLFSTTCGDYCILLALFWSRGYTMQEFINIMSEIEDVEFRDHAVRRLLLSTYDDNSNIMNSLKNDGNVGIDSVHVQQTIPFLFASI